jgi:hypothetical protein
MQLPYRIRPPCAKCPYKLGQVYTLTNPCPNCKSNGYRAFEQFKKSKLKGETTNGSKC